jgi:hypothetical protein
MSAATEAKSPKPRAGGQWLYQKKVSKKKKKKVFLGK